MDWINDNESLNMIEFSNELILIYCKARKIAIASAVNMLEQSFILWASVNDGVTRAYATFLPRLEPSV